jgi:hypothetical protein
MGYSLNTEQSTVYTGNRAGAISRKIWECGQFRFYRRNFQVEINVLISSVLILLQESSVKRLLPS